jgi:hypothetical protein
MTAGSGSLHVAPVRHVGAAITVAFTPRAAAPSPLVAPTIGADEVLARAAEHGDPHVLKFAEACALENTLNSDPAYLAAATQLITQLPGWNV